MKIIIRNLLLIFFILFSSQAFGERGCESLNIFLDLALKQKRPITQATDIEKRLHALMGDAADVRYRSGENYVEAKNLRYENGQVVFTDQNGKEIYQKIDDDFSEFFKLADEVPQRAPDVPAEAVAQADGATNGALVPSNGGSDDVVAPGSGATNDADGSSSTNLALSSESPAVKVEGATENLPAARENTDVVPYVHQGEIVEPGTGVSQRVNPAGSIGDDSKILDMDLGADGVWRYNNDSPDISSGVITLKDSDLSTGNVPIDITRTTDQPLRLEGPPERLQLAAPDNVSGVRATANRVTKSDIPAVDNVITFTTPAGQKTFTGRVLGINEESVRLLIKNSDGTTSEVTRRFRDMNRASIQTLTDIPASLVPRPTRANIPEVDTVVSFTTPGGQNSFTGRVLGINDESVRLLIKNSDGTTSEVTRRFRDMSRDSIQTVTNVPAALVPRPTKANIPEVESVIAFTTPGGQNSFTGKVLAINEESVRLRLEDGTEVTRRFRDMSRDSIQKIEGRDIPVSLTTQSTSTEVAVRRPTQAAVVNDIEDASEPGTSLTLTNNTDVARGTGTEVEPRVLDGELLGPEVAVREQTAGRLEGPVIEGTATRVDETVEALDESDSVLRLSYDQRAQNLLPPPRFGAEDFKPFYGDSTVRFDLGDSEMAGTFVGHENGMVIFKRVTGEEVRFDASKIDRSKLDVLDMGPFKKPDADIIFVDSKGNAFKGDFGAVDDLGSKVSDDEVIEVLRAGGRVKNTLNGMIEIISRGNKTVKVSIQKLLDAGVTMANRAGDIRVNFKQISNLNNIGRGAPNISPGIDLWNFIWSDNGNGVPAGPEAVTPEPTTPEVTPTPTPTSTTGGDDDSKNDSDDDDGGDGDEDRYGIPPAPSGNPVRPQFQQQQKLKIIRTRGVY